MRTIRFINITRLRNTAKSRISFNKNDKECDKEELGKIYDVVYEKQKMKTKEGGEKQKIYLYFYQRNIPINSHN